MKPSPAQQKQYDMFITQARKVLYEQTSIEGALKKMGMNKPEVAIGHTAAMIAQSIKGGLEQQGMPVEQAVVNGAVKSLVNDILEIAVAADVLPEDEAKGVAKGAVEQGVKLASAAPEAKQPQQGGPQPAPQPQQQPTPQPPQQGGLVQQAMGA